MTKLGVYLLLGAKAGQIFPFVAEKNGTEAIKCHSCQVTVDSEGMQIGVGDARCFVDAGSTPLIDCPTEATSCVTELFMDWLGVGGQETMIRRGCALKEASKDCQEGSSERIMYKDCLENCNGDGCNKELTVGDKVGGKQEACYTCHYKEDDDGNVSGNKNCGTIPDGGNSTDGNSTFAGETPYEESKCPNWAMLGCYIGSAVHTVSSSPREEIYKGCSSFELAETKYYEQELEEGVRYSLVKEFCTGTNCNEGHERPEDPGQGDDETPCTCASAHNIASILTIVSLFTLSKF